MAALARRSPRARLYSLVPRSSQCPSISASWSGWALSHAALASSVLASPERIADESKAKYTGLRASLILYSSAGAGAGGAGAGAAASGAGAGAGAAGAGAAGGGADATVIPGRLGQPVISSARPRADSTRAINRIRPCMGEFSSQFWMTWPESTLMVLPHQLCVREASRSRRVTFGFLPSLSLRNEKRPCSPEAKCVVWPRQSAHSSDVAQPAANSASPAIASRLSFRMLFILFVLRLCKLQAARIPVRFSGSEGILRARHRRETGFASRTEVLHICRGRWASHRRSRSELPGRVSPSRDICSLA